MAINDQTNVRTIVDGISWDIADLGELRPFYWNGLTINSAWRDVENEITYPFKKFKESTVEDWKQISNFIPHFTMYIIIYPWRDLSELIHVSKMGLLRF